MKATKFIAIENFRLHTIILMQLLRVFIYTVEKIQERIQDSEKGGHNYVTVSMVIVCEVHNLACKACQI